MAFSWSLKHQLRKTDPFGTAANDLPLNAMCNTIKRNMLDMTFTGETGAGSPLQSDLILFVYYSLNKLNLTHDR